MKHPQCKADSAPSSEYCILTEMHTKTDGKKLHVDTLGRGTNIVLLHGWGGSAESMRPLATRLAKNFRSTILDLPGFGESDPPEPTWGIAEYSRLIAKYIKRNYDNPIVLFGHSFGGTIGIHIAASNPELINKLILCAPSYKRPPHTTKSNRQKILKAMALHLPNLARFYYKLRHPSSDAYKFPKLQSNYETILKQDLSDTTENIIAPTLILWGTADKDAPFENAQYLETTISKSRLAPFHGKTHGLPLSDPDQLYWIIKEFVENDGK